MKSIKDIINFVDTIPDMLGRLFIPVDRVDFVSNIKTIILQWREYKDLEEQGKLPKLPCKAGQRVYLLRKDIKRIVDGEITSITISEFASGMRIFIVDDNRYTDTSFDKIGEIVFFMQEAAEAALKEMSEWQAKDREMRIIRKFAEFVGYTLYHGERFNEWRCPNKKCGFHVSEDYTCCPYCGQKIKFNEPPKVKMIEISMRVNRE